jgi:hypothetical protein
VNGRRLHVNVVCRLPSGLDCAERPAGKALLAFARAGRHFETQESSSPFLD